MTCSYFKPVWSLDQTLVRGVEEDGFRILPCQHGYVRWRGLLCRRREADAGVRVELKFVATALIPTPHCCCLE
eukprot:2534167-Amphidinium_carterae.1